MENDHDVPAELLQSLPRCTKIRLPYLFACIFMITFVAGVCLYLVNVIYNRCLDEELLKKTGVAVEAQVIGLTISSGRRGSLYYEVTYKYTPLAANSRKSTPQINTSQTDKLKFLPLKTGQYVPILYAPARPGVADLNFNDVIHQSNPFQMMSAVAWVIAIVVAGGVFTFVPGLLLYLREKRLVQWGCAVSANILKTETVKGNRPVISVSYQFVDQHGNTVQGLKNIPAEGQPGYELFHRYFDNPKELPVALYDPENNFRNILYPSRFVCCYRAKNSL